MTFQGNLRKMRVENADVIQYYLPIGDSEVYLNPLIGMDIRLRYLNQINCIKCGRKTSKSFSQGFCYPCFQTAPETEECVLRPELCQAHKGIARDMEYAESHCLIDHFVYLSLTSNIKVGVTRHTQVPTRWIDQGATKATKLALTPNRHEAGRIEVALKATMADKTNWRHMLTGKTVIDANILQEKQKAIANLPKELHKYIIDDNEVTELHYPIEKYPQKVSSLNLDKTPVIEGKLTGIKGQYLFFDNEMVINIRKFGGYLISFESRNESKS